MAPIEDSPADNQEVNHGNTKGKKGRQHAGKAWRPNHFLASKPMLVQPLGTPLDLSGSGNLESEKNGALALQSAVVDELRDFTSSQIPERKLEPQDCVQCGSADHSGWCCPNGNCCIFCSGKSSQWRACPDLKAAIEQMQSLARKRLAREISEKLLELRKGGHRPTMEVYMLAISGYVARRLPAAAEGMLDMMAQDGLPPDAVAFNAVLNGWCESKKMDEALALLSRMRQAGCELTNSTYNTVIKGLGAVNRAEDAMKVMRIMERSTVAKPSVRTYNMVMNAWCVDGNVEEARAVMGMMRKAGVAPDVVSYNTLVKAYGSLGRPSDCERVMREMVNAYLRPNERTFGLVVKAYCDERRMEEALSLVEHMKDYSVAPNVPIFNTLMKGFAQSLEPESAAKVFQMMVVEGLEPDVASYSTLMNAWSSAGEPEKARAALDEMISRGVQPDVEIFSVLAKGYLRTREGEKAERLLEEMRGHGLEPNVVTYTTVISAYCSKSGRMEDAMRVFEQMKQSRVRPNVFTFRALIWGFSEAKKPRNAEELLLEMEQVGIETDAQSYDQVASAWHSLRLHREGERVTEMKKEKLKLGEKGRKWSKKEERGPRVRAWQQSKREGRPQTEAVVSRSSSTLRNAEVAASDNLTISDRSINRSDFVKGERGNGAAANGAGSSAQVSSTTAAGSEKWTSEKGRLKLARGPSCLTNWSVPMRADQKLASRVRPATRFMGGMAAAGVTSLSRSLLLLQGVSVPCTSATGCTSIRTSKVESISRSCWKASKSAQGHVRLIMMEAASRSASHSFVAARLFALG